MTGFLFTISPLDWLLECCRRWRKKKCSAQRSRFRHTFFRFFFFFFIKTEKEKRKENVKIWFKVDTSIVFSSESVSLTNLKSEIHLTFCTVVCSRDAQKLVYGYTTKTNARSQSWGFHTFFTTRHNNVVEAIFFLFREPLETFPKQKRNWKFMRLQVSISSLEFRKLVYIRISNVVTIIPPCMALFIIVYVL